jgi:DNA-binding NarL/FixJ family response regulator
MPETRYPAARPAHTQTTHDAGGRATVVGMNDKVARIARPAKRSASPDALRCLIVEDETMFLQLLVAMLRTTPVVEVRATATTAKAAIEVCREDAFELLILDLKLPDANGLDVLRAAVAARPAIECIVLSSAAGEFACPQELLPNLRFVIDKTQAYEQLQDAIAEIARTRGIATPADTDAAAVLRPRELDVFRLIGQGMSTAEISSRLGIAKNTVETHRKSIAGKLGAKGAELVRRATIHNQISLPD